jgi:hypothetical protein
MPQTISLVSRDEALQNTGALILEGAGSRTIKTGSLISAVQLSSHCQMSIIGHTLSLGEQDDFIDRVHEEIQAYISYVSLWTNAAWGALDPVVKCFAPHPGGSRVCIMEESNLIAWPKGLHERSPRHRKSHSNRDVITTCSERLLTRSAFTRSNPTLKGD